MAFKNKRKKKNVLASPSSPRWTDVVKAVAAALSVVVTIVAIFARPERPAAAPAVIATPIDMTSPRITVSGTGNFAIGNVLGSSVVINEY